MQTFQTVFVATFELDILTYMFTIICLKYVKYINFLFLKWKSIGSIEIYYSDSKNLITNLGISRKFRRYAEMRVGTSSDTEPGLRTHNISSKRHKLLKVLNLYLKNLFFKLP